jgi:dienelactone hydrolase
MRRLIREEEAPRPSLRLSTLGERLTVVARDRHCDPRQLQRLLRGELDWIVLKSLEKDRTRRYESASNFAADVLRYLNDQPVHACPPSLAYRLRKFARRNRSAVLATGALALLAVVVAAAAWLYQDLNRRAGDVRAQAEDAEKARVQAEQAHMDLRWAHGQIPTIREAIRKERYREAFDLLRKVERIIPDDPVLPELREQCAQTHKLTSIPPGADIWCKPYGEWDAEWQYVGKTGPEVTEVPLPRGVHLWKATKQGYRDVTGLRSPDTVLFRLDEEGTIPADMVRVGANTFDPSTQWSSVALQSVKLPSFLIDQYEVTNEQFKKFVDAGGYENAECWRDLPFVDADGKPATWAQMKPLLVDQSGRPGPSTWQHGTYPPGEENHPVRGVSWYEAVAYSRYARKSLPTVYHWLVAAKPRFVVGSAILSGNFRGPVLDVRQLQDPGVFGTCGLFGNVKEWCHSDAGNGKRFILGGACTEPDYLASALIAEPALKRDELFGFRCVDFLQGGKGPAAAWEAAPVRPWRVFPKADQLFNAEQFQLIVKNRFTYDHAAPLEVTSREVDEGAWTHVIAEFNAAYQGSDGKFERMTAHLFLPKGVDARKGYQTIIYCPGTHAFRQPGIRPLPEEVGLDFLVRSGRAVLWPIYKGTYERRGTPPADLRAREQRQIEIGQDLSRAIDYLKHRGDVNLDQLGYYGLSWGASSVASRLAVEDRIRAAVLEGGGLMNLQARKTHLVLDWVHALPHIKIPVLMLNGRHDTIFPLKESQEPMFRLLGSPIKEHHVEPAAGHLAPRAVKVEKTLAWFDKHLGKPPSKDAAATP